MNNSDHEYRTAETSLAAYLITEGYKLLIIEYDARQRGTYVFDLSDTTLVDSVRLYHRGEATVNLVVYEGARNSLIDRVKRGLP